MVDDDAFVCDLCCTLRLRIGVLKMPTVRMCNDEMPPERSACNRWGVETERERLMIVGLKSQRKNLEEELKRLKVSW